jgi:DNA mismatch endonuclease (patch repair protein)
VDGCFWHGCPKHATRPKNNRAFWRRKLSANKARDRLVNRTLRRAGWRVLRIWEHSLRQVTMKRATKKPQKQARLLNRIRRVLAKRQKLKR